jgi:dihydropteroate synthase-like protein
MPEYLFVTGKLAADALTDTLQKIEPDFDYEVAVLNISVTALMTTEWLARKLPDARGCRQVMISGWCQGELALLEEKLGVPVTRGPKDLKDLPVYFGAEPLHEGYGDYRLKIMAEITEAYRMSFDEILAQAEYFRANGADIIDLGGSVNGGIPRVAEIVTGLKAHGFAVSIDTFDTDTILRADEAGVDYLLSVNSKNIELAPRLRCLPVVIPDFDTGLPSLERNIARLEEWGVPYIIDPILNPINFGLMDSLYRFYETRRRHPDKEILMGLANLTELTDADSTGINALMTGILTEMGIEYVLVTEVISWAKGSVKEIDLARKLMYYTHQNGILPKRVTDGLITIKDPPFTPYSETELKQMHKQVRDPNFRIFTDRNYIYLFNRDVFLRGTSADEIFAQLDMTDASHAFYLGRELEKAALAVQLGKKYVQDNDLRWGYMSNRLAGQ